MKTFTMATAAAALAFGSAATAQTTSSKAPATAAAPTATADADSATMTSADVSDGDVDQFASAVLAVQKVAQDSSVAGADKQAKMADAVKQSGLSPEKFNAIARASQSDPALMKRIQTAAAAKFQAQGSAGTSTKGG